MPYYSDEVIDRVREANDIVDVIGQYVSLKKKGASYFGLCPFHNEKTGSFSVSPDKQIYYCFGCHAGGNVIRFLQNYENLTFPEALKELADRAGIELPTQSVSAEQRRAADRRTKLLEIQKEAATYYYSALRDKRGELGLSYFKKRELTDETMRKFALGYADRYGDTLYRYLKSKGYADDILRDSGLVSYSESHGGQDKFWNRVIFPIMDANNHVIAFGGRVMGDGKPKYLNSPETPIFYKSRTLYGLNLAKHTKRRQWILCEGYMDVIALHQAGFDNAVATLGTALTTEHAALLHRYTDALYLSYDSDDAGINAALRAIPILRDAGLRCRIIDMSPHKDPDEFIKALGAGEYEKRIEAAENGFMFSVRMLERKYDISDPNKPDERTEFMYDVVDMLMGFPDKIERDNYVDAVASRYHFSKESLEEEIKKRAREGTKKSAARSPVTTTPQTAANDSVRRVGRQKKRDGYETSQMQLLNWIVEDVSLLDKIKDYIEPRDFREGILRDTASKVFSLIEAGEAIRPAQFVDMAVEEDDQAMIAEIFSTEIADGTDDIDKRTALKETIYRIKDDSFKKRYDKMNAGDPATAQWVIAQKKLLKQIMKTDFV